MERVQMTNGDLHQLDLNMQKLSTDYPAFVFLNKEKIKNFYQRNAMLLNIIKEFGEALIKKYARHDREGNPVLIKKEGINHYTFIIPEVEQTFVEKMAEFNNRTINVEL